MKNLALYLSLAVSVLSACTHFAPLQEQKSETNLLGLGEARTVRRWIGGDAQIPYAAWRLYLILTGRV